MFRRAGTLGRSSTDMIPGARTAEGQIRIVSGPPAATDPRLGGFALTPLGEIYTVGTQSAFSPADLFLNGEQGVWYDPSDLSTMFQDSDGTTPVTVDGQPVGLILDKSQGLVIGSERITNGDFSSGSTNWSLSAGWTVTGGALNVNQVGSTIGATQPFAVVAGTTYKVTFTISNYISGQVVPVFGGGSNASAALASSNGQFATFIVAGTGNTEFRLLTTGAGFVGTVDNISVKKISGNHASQATAAARPLYKTDGTYHWLQFDGIDDSLSTGNISSILGILGTVWNGNFHTSSTHWVDVWLTQQASEGFFAAAESGQTTKPQGNVMGSPLYRRNGIDLASPTRADLHADGIEQRIVQTVENLRFGDPAPQTGISIGGYAGFLLRGNIYSLIVRGALSTPQEITETETWVNGKTGAY